MGHNLVTVHVDQDQRLYVETRGDRYSSLVLQARLDLVGQQVFAWMVDLSDGSFCIAKSADSKFFFLRRIRRTCSQESQETSRVMGAADVQANEVTIPIPRIKKRPVIERIYSDFERAVLDHLGKRYASATFPRYPWFEETGAFSLTRYVAVAQLRLQR